MKYTVRNNEIKKTFAQRRTKEIHLRKHRPLQVIFCLELLREPQGVEASVNSYHRAMGNREKVCQLTCATSDFDYAGVIRNLLVQQSSESTRAGLFNQSALIVKIIVIRE